MNPSKKSWTILAWMAPLLVLAFVDLSILRALYRADDYAVVMMATLTDFPYGVLRSQLGAWWRPLAAASYYVDYDLFGLWHGGSFLVHWLIHGANALLAAELYRRIAGQREGAWVVYLIALFHPAGIQTILMLTQRSDLAGTTFYLVALLAFLRYLSDQRRLYLVGSVGAFILALGFKEMMITFPAVAVIFGWIEARKKGQPALPALVASWPFWIAALGYWMIRSRLVFDPLAYQEMLGKDWLWIQILKFPWMVLESIKALFGFTGTAFYHAAGGYAMVFGAIFCLFQLRGGKRLSSVGLMLSAAIAFTPVWSFAMIIYPRFAYLPVLLFWAGAVALVDFSSFPRRAMALTTLALIPSLFWARYHPTHIAYEERIRMDMQYQVEELDRVLGPPGEEKINWVEGWSPDNYLIVVQRAAYVEDLSSLSRIGALDFPHFQIFDRDEAVECAQFLEDRSAPRLLDMGFYKAWFVQPFLDYYCGAAVSQPDMKKFHEGLADHPQWLDQYKFYRYADGTYVPIDPPGGPTISQ